MRPDLRAILNRKLLVWRTPSMLLGAALAMAGLALAPGPQSQATHISVQGWEAGVMVVIPLAGFLITTGAQRLAARKAAPTGGRERLRHLLAVLSEGHRPEHVVAVLFTLLAGAALAVWPVWPLLRDRLFAGCMANFLWVAPLVPVVQSGCTAAAALVPIGTLTIALHAVRRTAAIQGVAEQASLAHAVAGAAGGAGLAVLLPPGVLGWTAALPALAGAVCIAWIPSPITRPPMPGASTPQQADTHPILLRMAVGALTAAPAAAMIGGCALLRSGGLSREAGLGLVAAATAAGLMHALRMRWVRERGWHTAAVAMLIAGTAASATGAVAWGGAHSPGNADPLRSTEPTGWWPVLAVAALMTVFALSRGWYFAAACLKDRMHATAGFAERSAYGVCMVVAVLGLLYPVLPHLPMGRAAYWAGMGAVLLLLGWRMGSVQAPAARKPGKA